jgi:hypothetical protein
MNDPKEKLRQLFESDFNGDVRQFRAAVKELLKPHPRQRKGHARRLTRTPGVLALLWAKIEFMRWRVDPFPNDPWRSVPGTIEAACEALNKHNLAAGNGKEFEIYDTDDHTWRIRENGKPTGEPEPPKRRFNLSYNATSYNDYSALTKEQRDMGEFWLDQMKAAEKGNPSALSAKFMQESFPPKEEVTKK